MRLPGVMRGAVEGVGARGSGAGRDDPLESPPGVLGESGAAGSAVRSSGAVRLARVVRTREPGGGAGRRGGSGVPHLLRPTGRPAWWDGVSHVVTRLACLDHLNAVGPLAFRWTTWFTKYGGPTELKWSNRI